MKRTIIVLSIIMLFGWLGDFFNHIEQPSTFKNGYFNKYDQRMAEKETGDNRDWR